MVAVARWFGNLTIGIHDVNAPDASDCDALIPVSAPSWRDG